MQCLWYVRGIGQEYSMQSVHDPHFFECEVPIDGALNYQLAGKRRETMSALSMILMPFKSPRVTDYDQHLFAEGNHHRIYEKLGAHLTTLRWSRRGLLCPLGS